MRIRYVGVAQRWHADVIRGSQVKMATSVAWFSVLH